MSNAVSLVVTGDFHIGRFPSHAPVGERALSVEAIWDATVDLAIAESVDAIVLTGDIADEDNKLFEAIGPLRLGVDRLWREGIRTIAVTGNHDFDVLRRLSKLVDDEAFTLLGAGGTWTETVIEKDGETKLRLLGWSFPSRHVHESPLETFPTLEPGVPTLGVVHGDREVAGSRYAPLSRASLAASGADGWLLGHIHRPSLSEAGATQVLYPGSPQPLDPGETGAHGPWLVTVQPGGGIDARQKHLATVRYDGLVVDLSDAADREGVETALTRALDDHLAAVEAEQPSAAHLVVDLRLRGRSAAFSVVEEVAAQIRDQHIPGASATATVRRVVSDVRPARDLGAVALRNDPAGALAQVLLDLDGGGDASGLLGEAVRAMRGLEGISAFAPLKHESGSGEAEADARQRLLAQGFRLLDSLLLQTDSTD